MKSQLLFIFILISQISLAQDDLYLLFEWMVVNQEQSIEYAETENFWEKIHEQRVKNGEIIGWDLWSLQPGGEWQEFQYLTVHLYDNPVKMMEGASWASLMENAKKAYPNLTEAAIEGMVQESAKTRDLAVRQYLQRIDFTEGDFEMPLGTVARINMMKAAVGQASAYVAGERDIFKPLHQQAVNSNNLGSWGLASVLVPSGSDIYADYITFDMFRDYEHMFDSSAPWSELTGEELEKLNEAIATRDLKKTFVGRLIKKLR